MRIASQIRSVLGVDIWRPAARSGLEIVGDPYDVFAPGVVDHPFAAILALVVDENGETRVPKSVCGRVCYQCRSSEPIPPERSRL